MTYPTMYVALDVSGNPLGTSPTWTEVTEWVCHETMRITRGRSRGSDDFQPASGSFSLICEEGRFDPTDTSGAYYPNFGLRTRVYIAANVGLDAYDLAAGFITSVNVRWNHRGEQIADVQWVDLLGILATYELPESVWDWVVAQRSPAVWHKLGSDQTNVARDYSGNDRHGRYVTYEGSTSYYDSQATPTRVVLDGVSDPILQSVDRPSQSWGKMIASADQPLNTAAYVSGFSNWRATSVKCDQWTSYLQDNNGWTIEGWCTIQPAYGLDPTNLKAGNVIDLGMFSWGDLATNTNESTMKAPLWRLAVRANQGYPRLTYVNPVGSVQAYDIGSSGFTDALRAQPMWFAWVRNGPALQFYAYAIDTGLSLFANYADVSAAPKAYGFPMVIAPSTGRGGVSNTYAKCGWWGAFGDVVVYTTARSDVGDLDITRNAAAYGHIYGSSVGANPFPPGDLIYMIAVDMLAATDLHINLASYDDNGHNVDVGPFNRRTALEVLRLAAASEGGPLYVNKSGDLVFLVNTWPLTMTEAATVQWVLTDDDIVDASALGHTGGTLSLDDSQIVNDCTVTWKGGTAQHVNETSVARYGRFRKSITTALIDPDDAKQRAAWETWRRADPVPDLGSVTVEPTTDLEWQAALSLDFGHRVRVILTRPDGSKFDRECHVESLTHSIDMGQGMWRTTLSLFAADSPGAPFVIGTSLLDGDDVLWY